MLACTTIKIPEPFHERLKQRSRSSGVSIPALIVRALEETYASPALWRLAWNCLQMWHNFLIASLRAEQPGVKVRF